MIFSYVRKLRRSTKTFVFLSVCCILTFFLFFDEQKLAAAFAASPIGDTENDKIGTIFRADRVFDGSKTTENTAILVVKGKVARVGKLDELLPFAKQVHDLGDTTILPGFIELHAHLLFRRVPPEIVLRHGITTLRDVGGPLVRAAGGDGRLRILTAGPIITVQKGYPISVFGKGYIAEPVDDPKQARTLVRRLVEEGAAVIKIAIEPGGEIGAPWSMHHHEKDGEPWPIPTVELVRAIVEEAHSLNKITTAHVGERSGAAIAVSAGVDEWAHIPCEEIDDDTLKLAVQRNIRIVTTLDTMSHCHGIFNNGRKLAKLGAKFLYGAEIAHSDIPWGIDARELELMQHMLGMSPEEVFKAATSDAGKELGSDLLGTLLPGAPADLIAIRGDAVKNFKALEYPALVVSGGVVIVNDFEPPRKTGVSTGHRSEYP